jgi:hypothetical protein
MRIHCLENVDKALQFLKEQKVHLENMGSHDIVDGNHRLTLGLVWTIILRFQVPSFPRTGAMHHKLLLLIYNKINTKVEHLDPCPATGHHRDMMCAPDEGTRLIQQGRDHFGVGKLPWQVTCAWYGCWSCASGPQLGPQGTVIFFWQYWNLNSGL